MISFLWFLVAFAFAETSALDGSYLRPCYQVGDDVLSSRVQVKGETWDQTHTAYEDEACQLPYLIYEVRYQGKAYQQNLDLQAIEASYTSFSDEVTEALNMVAYCGFSNWRTHQQKIVTGLVCDEFRPPTKGQSLYSIFKIENRAGGKSLLYLGEPKGSDDGKTASARHPVFGKAPYMLMGPPLFF